MSALNRLSAALADRYRIERELGAGGMATVYLAFDIKHDRRVALKVLKPELAAVLGADRFVVEIKTTAALQHPHILPLFDSGEADGFLFYVMPFIDGETLRSKLDRETQLGVDESVKIATNVADALDYAHRHGVIHRDIKPENILLHEGRPMVADFGIALAVSAAAGGRMTETGLSLGTPHYMSPEQATAEKEISARSDIYSLASVLYEMLAGQPPHTGGSAQQIIMKIITEEPADVTSLRKSVPSNVAAAIARALEKLPADRFESAQEFAHALLDKHFTGTGTLAASAVRDGPWKNRFYAAVAIAVLASVAAVTQVTGPRASADPPAMHLRLPLQPGDRLAAPEGDNLRNADRPSRTAFTFTPDGRALVYSGVRNGRQMLFLRPLAGEVASPIAGTEGGESPFFSPDGTSLGFWAAGRLRRVSLDGGPATDIAVTPRIAGASWSDDDRIVVGVREIGLIIHSVTSAAAPDTLIRAAAGLPQWLPGGNAIVFTSDRRLDNNTAQIEAVELSSGNRTVLIAEGEDARYVSTGHLVFGRDGAMMAVRFNVDRLEVIGSPIVVIDDVMQARNGMNTGVRTGAMQVAISPHGQLAWVTGGVTPDRVATVAWLDRQGRRTPVPTIGAGAFFMARLSPDERQFALFEFGRPPRMVVVDRARQSSQTLPGPETPFILWTPDSRRLVYTGAVRDSAALVA
ncbi:MAG TPA: protein kinase, partial [Longimicrobiales bacterium]|nr:protein kinase [Longimicrobiales bacterium]